MNRGIVESRELQVYQSLLGRKNFSPNEKIAHYNAQQGYEGEVNFFKMIESQLHADYLALYGLLLENQGSLSQIDCLIIFPNQMIMFEVKNFRGEFEFHDNRLYSLTHEKHYQNPLHQLHRTETNLRDLLSRLKINIPLHSHLVFINEEFTLYTEKMPTLIIPTQLNSFIQKLNQIQGRLSAQHHALAEKLIHLHKKESPFMRLPSFEYAELRKGVLCYRCRRLLELMGKSRFYCNHCSYEESTDSGIIRNVIEFHTLFPDKKIKTRKIAEWSAQNLSKKTYQRILSTYLHQHKLYRNTYYRFK